MFFLQSTHQQRAKFNDPFEPSEKNGVAKPYQADAAVIDARHPKIGVRIVQQF